MTSILELEKRIKQAFQAGVVQMCLITLVIVIAMLSGQKEGRLGYFNDPFLFVDVLIYAVLLFFIYRRSFVALALFCMYFFINVLIGLTEGIGNIIGALIFGYFYVRGLVAAWEYRRITSIKAGPQEEKQRPKIPVGVWIGIACAPFGLLFVLIMVLGTLITAGISPDTKILCGKEIPSGQRDVLNEMGLLLGNEEILYFYSEGIFSVREAGNLLTDRRVISYEKMQGNLDIYSARFDEIKDTEIYFTDSFFDDSLLEVYTSETDGFMLYLSNELDRDHDFYDTLEDILGGKAPLAAFSCKGAKQLR